ncbi:MAG: hypothetical protein A2284_18910 [Deltaproteobacteria bacterium RIFOXYA12_FULL_61_11]|nr:MAG: hypothetical protein A2284_18910 [Deltaproteobacteria bacterium RIFOXYA12_FULL_61_11]
MAKRRSQSDHDQMVKAVAVHLENEGYCNVAADVKGYDPPTKIIWKRSDSGHVPDATADGIIVEVETADSINNEHTADQWTLFAAYAAEHDQVFVVVVPEGSKASATRRLRELDVSAEVWTA